MLKPQLVLFYEDNYNFLSKMCLGRMRRAACEMLRAGARARRAAAWRRAPTPRMRPRNISRPARTPCCTAKRLATLMALVDRLDHDSDARGDGTAGSRACPTSASPERTVRSASRGSRAAAGTGARAALPAWDLVDIENYRRVWRRAHGYFSLNMAASRGCSFRCNWCAKPIWGNQYLQRPPREVAAEMIHLRRHYRPDHIWFADDIFGFQVDWVNEFAAALAAGDGGVPFTIQLRADLVSTRMAEALRDAGCREVWIGAESGSQKILDAMNKGTRVRENIHARRLLGEAGIRVGFFLQLGYLGEELDDILATRRLVEEARPDDVGVSVSYPLPGTKFYELVKQQLGEQAHWQESNDLEMMFDGTYRSEFYRAVRNLLHDQVTQPDSPEVARRWDELCANEARLPPEARKSIAALEPAIGGLHSATAFR